MTDGTEFHGKNPFKYIGIRLCISVHSTVSVGYVCPGCQHQSHLVGKTWPLETAVVDIFQYNEAHLKEIHDVSPLHFEEIRW